MRALANLLNAALTHPLNARSPGAQVAALGLVLRRQIAIRLLPGAEFVLPFANGSKLAVTRGMVGAPGSWHGTL